MKLRTKLIWAGIVLVLVPMLFSTGVMWYLIRRQNDEDAREYSGRLLDLIRKELDHEGTELVQEMLYFSQDSALVNNLTNLNQRKQVNMTPMLQEIHKTEAALSGEICPH